MENFLTRIELQGFKSFAQKNVFELDKNTVAIVGPNGSGKSNVIDAVRWVFGEREAKQLRGDSLSNLIFAGTPKKSPGGMARVSLVFNNKEGVLPVDAEEVTLTRRIDRSGVSQFFMNGEEIKLRDLVPFLAKAKLGHRGMTIIGQGQADIFVKINAEERRTMIEEILGLKEYRLKKKTAERRLEKTKINVDQMKAKLEEITPHLRFLRKQKKKWEKRVDVSKQLKEFSHRYFSFHYHSLKNKISYNEEKIGDISAERSKKFKEVSVLADDVKKIKSKDDLKDRMGNIRKEIDVLNSEKLEKERQMIRLEAKMEFSKNSDKESTLVYSVSRVVELIKSFIKEAENISENEKNAVFFINKWKNEFGKAVGSEKQRSDNADSKNKEIYDEVDVLKQKIKETGNKISNLKKEEDKVITEREKDNTDFRSKVEKLEQQKDELRRIDDEIGKLNLAEEKLKFQMRELENKWASLGNDREILQNIAPLEKEPEEDWDKVERKIDRLRSELSAIGEIDEALIQEADETEERYNFMSKEVEDLEKAALDLQKLIRELEEKIQNDFKSNFQAINSEFNKYFRTMFRGGKAKMKLVSVGRQRSDVDSGGQQEEAVSDSGSGKGEEEEKDKSDINDKKGVDISLQLPRKKINSLDMLSGGEETLVSIAALFALIAVSPPPFLVLDEIDAALDEVNAKKFAELIEEFSEKTQFVIVTHNRITMETADILYGITMENDGVSRVLSLKLEDNKTPPNTG